MTNETIISDLQKTGKKLMDLNLAWGTAGNISARKDEDHFFITASGTNLGELNDDDFVLVPNHHETNKKPSKEFPMHRAIYENRPEINAVLHSAPFYSTLLACSSLNLPSNYFVEAMYYLEKVVHIPYKHPGSNDLAKAVEEKVTESNVFILKNHGILVCDVSIKEAFMALETLEFASKMLITSIEKGIKIEGLPQEQVDDFLNNAGYKPRRKW
ncbi:class II aldolase/adducin family protein [Oceanobacillus jeddahense]|uniref:class II aldolase/adducin family protein n=1 Tax=Oceanobacillus jeddahense TaxID=1462527 RepID=UPI000595AEEB|nr:class II aldolase/adducin family protein [Oceanobacillus jeddahense]